MTRGDESVHRDQMHSLYRFAQFDDAQIESNEARAIILYLDAALADAQRKIDRERNRRKAARTLVCCMSRFTH